MDGTSMLVMLVSSAVGSGMALYGFRQKEPVALAFGVAICLVPWVLSGWAGGVACVALAGAFMAARKRL